MSMTPRENYWKVVNHEEGEWIPIFWGGTNSSIVPQHYGALCEELGVEDPKRPVGDFGTVYLHPLVKERLHSDVELLVMGAPPRRYLEDGTVEDELVIGLFFVNIVIVAWKENDA